MYFLLLDLLNLNYLLVSEQTDVTIGNHHYITSLVQKMEYTWLFWFTILV